MMKVLNHNTLRSQDVIDRYFLEHRAKLIDLAAFLDRLDRTCDHSAAGNDYRISFLLRAVNILSDGETNRAGRVLEIFSDKTTELPQSANGIKSAKGAAREESDS
ncbi:hypothetical protein ACFL5F_01095 [Planctomycetota bacterium]